VIGYYNRCTVILHFHLAAAALGAQTIVQRENNECSTLGIATALIARIAELRGEDEAGD
jgi:hypothetical protein